MTEPVCFFERACVCVYEAGQDTWTKSQHPPRGNGHCYQGEGMLSGRTGKQRERKDTDRQVDRNTGNFLARCGLRHPVGPSGWPTFISEIVGSCQSIVENLPPSPPQRLKDKVRTLLLYCLQTGSSRF